MPDFFVDRYEIAFLNGEQAPVDREATLSQGVLERLFYEGTAKATSLFFIRHRG